jgi:hypothetical protein
MPPAAALRRCDCASRSFRKRGKDDTRVRSHSYRSARLTGTRSRNGRDYPARGAARGRRRAGGNGADHARSGAAILQPRAADVALAAGGGGRGPGVPAPGRHPARAVRGRLAVLDLGLPAATFRKRLSRARERLREALASNCGVFNPAAACRCHRRLNRATALGRVRPGATSTDAPLDVAGLREKIQNIGEAMRVAAYYRADPSSKPRRDLVRAALEPFTATRIN